MENREQIRGILSRARTIAVVGLSANPWRTSHAVAAYLQKQGYRIVPVNPKEAGGTILGEKVYPDLPSIPDPVDIVNVFRRPEEVPPHAEEAIRIGAPVLWLQLGIINEEAARRAREAGLTVVMNRCIMVDHQSLL